MNWGSGARGRPSLSLPPAPPGYSQIKKKEKKNLCFIQLEHNKESERERDREGEAKERAGHSKDLKLNTKRKLEEQVEGDLWLF